MKLFELWSLKQCKIPYNFVVSKPALSHKQIKWKIVCWSESIYDFLAQVNFQVFFHMFLVDNTKLKYLSPALFNFLINYVWIIRSATGRLIITFRRFYKAGLTGFSILCDSNSLTLKITGGAMNTWVQSKHSTTNRRLFDVNIMAIRRK